MLKYIIYLTLLASPFFFASVKPIWNLMWVVVISTTAIIWASHRIVKKRYLILGSHLATLPMTPILLAGLFILWGFIQTMDLGLVSLIEAPNTNSETVNEIWTSLGTFSVTPEATMRVSSYFLSHLLFFILVFSALKRSSSSFALIKFIALTVGIYALYGFIVYSLGNNYILWYEKWTYKDSLTSTFVNRNSFSAYLGLGMIATSAWAIRHFGAATDKGLASNAQWSQLIHRFTEKGWIIILIFLIILTSLILTGSRAGVLSALIGTLSLILFWLSRNGSSLKISPIAVVALVASTIGLTMVLSGDLLDNRLSTDTADDLRFKAFPLVFDAIRERPLTGYGLGSFDEAFRLYRDNSIPNFLDRAHNDYLELIMSAGIPAFLLLMLVVSFFLKPLIHSVRVDKKYEIEVFIGLAATLQLALHSFVDFSLQIPAVSYLYITLLAMSSSLAKKH